MNQTFLSVGPRLGMTGQIGTVLQPTETQGSGYSLLIHRSRDCITEFPFAASS